ncbi:S9 family peptidase [Crocosphaera sp. Alani8]|uniref:S9 family peptidase n=1 Tax=Crocosphaera sp. Alani8 TaxID=3038952 RepID=UPI00313CD5E0
MSPSIIAPFGSWKSPITSDLIVAQSISLGGVVFDNNDIYWLEGRPQEKGRNVLVKYSPDGQITEITPQPFNVRTRVHEYGGGAFLVDNGVVYFVNYQDQRIYQQLPNEEAKPLTPENQCRYADFILDTNLNRLISVCEDHSNPDRECENKIVAIDINTGEITTLIEGDDFYSSPRLNPDGKQLAWISWNHPNMPWDGTKLWLANVETDGALKEIKWIAGDVDESINEPKWSPDGQLFYVSDQSGWANVYCYQSNLNNVPIFPFTAEFSYPHWVFGLCTYAFVSKEKVICTYTQDGRWYLGVLNIPDKQLSILELPYSNIGSLHSRGNQAVFVASSSLEPTSVVHLDLGLEKTKILKRSSQIDIDSDYFSEPELIEFPTENGLKAYAWYYAPKNKDYSFPEQELPPLLVKSHGGPTASATPSFSLKIQYWTSRGFGYLDVNYGGSTGFGKAYRQRLEKNWGVVDVNDCINGAKYLVEQGKVDGDRLAISGGSAGGYTTLAALTFNDTFKAGASYYGIGDLESLAKDTHKFESRYLDKLIGKYPEEKEIYEQRSPINFTDQLNCPVIFFQGLEDKVVPPNQAEMMVESLSKKGISVAYVPFEGEQHGFRQADNIKYALDSEFYFYSRIFNFTPADNLQSITILNYDS